MSFYINNIKEFIIFISVVFVFALIFGGAIDIVVQIFLWIISGGWR